jgi:hypothetical protein
MEMPYHLIQIIPQPNQLPVNQPFAIAAAFVFCGIDFAIFVEQQRAPEMNRAHADRLGALLDARQFAGGETKIELLVARF